MSQKYVVREQIYRNVSTGEIAQFRQEMSDGSTEWERPDGSIWDGPLHDPTSKQISPPRQKMFPVYSPHTWG